jgi:hypothetical protein
MLSAADAAVVGLQVILRQVERRSVEIDSLAYWLSNTSVLLQLVHMLQQALEGGSSGANSPSADGSMRSEGSPSQQGRLTGGSWGADRRQSAGELRLTTMTTPPASSRTNCAWAPDQAVPEQLLADDTRTWTRKPPRLLVCCLTLALPALRLHPPPHPMALQRCPRHPRLGAPGSWRSATLRSWRSSKWEAWW